MRRGGGAREHVQDVDCGLPCLLLDLVVHGDDLEVRHLVELLEVVEERLLGGLLREVALQQLALELPEER